MTIAAGWSRAQLIMAAVREEKAARESTCAQSKLVHEALAQLYKQRAAHGTHFEPSSSMDGLQ